jgi:hypothetical protein
MIQISLTRHISGAILALWTALFAGCVPVYLWETHTTSTPRPQAFDVAVLTREPVATLGPLTPAGLQGFNPFLSRGLVAAISEVSPPIRGIPIHETVNVVNGQGLAAEYGDLISGFVRSGILERERLRRIGSALGSRYVLLPGLAEFNETIIDRLGLRSPAGSLSRAESLRCGYGCKSGICRWGRFSGSRPERLRWRASS